ncbi:MAG: hypothetical protein A2W91_19425 [Bacteroidetes bacterium GWF2_38_335]|nr:MAG: hypothetical protein A2W91_19425 [Bacteroidetes bacterium GWF2_38_335]OFY79930.1 MAG: hypothetical protein A2281_10825 [Bacteroidetes bacterium RIFOXYA12_FULL_38_20]HBS86387.1 hypothetical protein [Bacteroidales bacterium]
MKKLPLFCFLSLIAPALFLFFCSFVPQDKKPGPDKKFNLKFNSLPESWDKGIPLGNGMLGALVWQKDGKLRISLDRADLWDLRPMDNLDKPEWKFSWVLEQWKNNTYDKVQNLFDAPYDQNPAPSKIPAGALEIDVSKFGKIMSVELYLSDGLCEIKWNNRVKLLIYIRSDQNTGWIRLEGVPDEIIPEICPPLYHSEKESESENPVTGQDISRLGYDKGVLIKTENAATYEQPGWNGFSYKIALCWQKVKYAQEICWTITSAKAGEMPKEDPLVSCINALKDGFFKSYLIHSKKWEEFWNRSDISVPDSVLQRQWYLEMYKMKAASGNNAPPVSLQAIWTADNGKLPPWKGDFHNDLNTQLSYWPCYSSNHLDEAMGFIDWLEKNKKNFLDYTKKYYEVEGLNVPGVSTLDGQPMGGWIQYAFGPTVSAWLAHHYYLQWRYSMDKEFLENKAWPWIENTAVFLQAISVMDSTGHKKLPLSSSPEIFDNSRNAWFPKMTNFDLALVRWTFGKAAELALELGKKDEAAKWKKELALWPQFDVDDISGLTFAKGFPYVESHRHFSHLMAIHPLGLIDFSNGKNDSEIIQKTIKNLDVYGPENWCGYSYAWLGNLKARAFDGEGAADALRTFATCFCFPNSFHVNGDQSGTGKSSMTYSPFTLEGNFAFAAGLQEMLIQSHTGVVRIFPAIPSWWMDAGFKNLRTEGAFLVSAKLEKGKVSLVTITAEKGGKLVLKNPFADKFECSNDYKKGKEGVLVFETSAGEIIHLSAI